MVLNNVFLLVLHVSADEERGLALLTQAFRALGEQGVAAFMSQMKNSGLRKVGFGSPFASQAFTQDVPLTPVERPVSLTAAHSPRVRGTIAPPIAYGWLEAPIGFLWLASAQHIIFRFCESLTCRGLRASTLFLMNERQKEAESLGQLLSLPTLVM
eukprot:283334-Pelagomonas_calceolata.AAC.1